MTAALRSAPSLHVGSFLQDVATIFTDLDGLPSKNVCTVACTPEGVLYAGTTRGLARYDKDMARWQHIGKEFPATEAIDWLIPDPTDGLYAGIVHNVYHLERSRHQPADKMFAQDAIAGAVTDKTPARSVFLACHTLFDSHSNAAIPLPDGATGRAVVFAPGGGYLVATDRGVYHFHNGDWHALETHSLAENVSGALLSPDVRDLVTDTWGGLWVATARGLNYYTQGAWLEISGEDGLPITDITSLALNADGTLWIGSAQGAACLSGGQWRYFAGQRWLPSDHVQDIATEASGDVWIATDSGLAHLTRRPMTLLEKASHYEVLTAARHNRDGYITDCRLTHPGDLTSFLYQASDNDGLWTALYVCAESYRYAVTGESEARALAQKSLRALLELVRVTGIPGFPARAIIRQGEQVEQSDPGPNWYPSPVDPNITYKNDTSSDEIDGHYMAWYVYSELVADAQEKQEIAEVCRAVTNHLLDHDYTLVGPTGKPTRWGVWRPAWLNNDPKWAAERGLNSLEILSHLKVAIHLCGEERFVDAYRSLIVEHHFALNTVKQKILPPEGENNHSDDELAAVAYYPLLRLETDPALRSLYLRSLERTQAILKPERSPFHNVLYGACCGRFCDAEAAIEWLQACPLDLRDWKVENSHRADVALDAAVGRFGERQLTHVLPAGENRVSKWNRNPYTPDGGNGGASEEDGTFWLLPYWMARYHGIIVEENQ